MEACIPIEKARKLQGREGKKKLNATSTKKPTATATMSNGARVTIISHKALEDGHRLNGNALTPTLQDVQKTSKQFERSKGSPITCDFRQQNQHQHKHHQHKHKHLHDTNGETTGSQRHIIPEGYYIQIIRAHKNTNTHTHTHTNTRINTHTHTPQTPEPRVAHFPRFTYSEQTCECTCTHHTIQAHGHSHHQKRARAHETQRKRGTTPKITHLGKHIAV